MKTIFITLHNTFAIRNLFRSGALSVLLNERDTRVVALVPEEKIPYYQKEFKDVIFERLPVEARNSWIERFFYFLTVDSIHTNSVKIQQYSQVFRIGSRSYFLQRIFFFPLQRLFWRLGAFSWWRPFVRRLYSFLPSGLYGELFEKYKPNLVFAANMIFADDYRLILEAKRRGIKTMGMILSWDNLMTKSFLQVFPDRLIVHNPIIQEDAFYYAGYPKERVIVTGIPQYDMYFRKNYIMPRDEFILSIGGDPKRKFILYAASGKTSMLFDIDIVDIIQRAIESGRVRGRPQLLVRPYPRYDFSPEKVKKVKSFKNVLIYSPVKHLGTGRDDWEFSDEALKFLVNSLAHSDVVIDASSTFLIEGVVFDKPTISALFDGYQKVDYWNSMRKMFDFEHLAAIKKIGAIDFSLSEDELYNDINEALENPGKRREERKKMVSRQCAFTDGKSAERVAKAILDTLNHAKN